jgi:hypothetical protein
VSRRCNDDVLMRLAATHIEIVMMLLLDGRVDASAHNNAAFYLALEGNHDAVMNVLLQDKRVRALLIKQRTMS